MKNLDEAIKLEPKKPNSRFYKGIVLGKLGKHEEALNCFVNICHSHPKHMDAFFHKGIELAELERHKEAIKIFDKLLDKHKDNVNVIYAKARSKAALNEIGESLALLKNAISKNSKVIKKWAQKEKIFERFQDNEQFQKLIK